MTDYSEKVVPDASVKKLYDEDGRTYTRAPGANSWKFRDRTYKFSELLGKVNLLTDVPTLDVYGETIKPWGIYDALGITPKGEKVDGPARAVAMRGLYFIKYGAMVLDIGNESLVEAELKEYPPFEQPAP